MRLIPPTEVPKPALRKVAKVLAIGVVAGTAVGAVLAYLLDEPALLIAGPFGGALVGLRFCEDATVLWSRRE